ncbi:Fc.00g011510.m01.CDS01 [Cosmosporella sp. VM-42]
MSDPGYKAFEEELAWLIDKIGNGKTPSNVSFSRHPAESIERQHANEGPWFLVPCSKNDVFVGRSSILQELDDWIGSPVENRRMGVHKRAAIQGLGGIGKTQVALQWAYKKHQEETDLSVFWVHASTAERFTDGYVSIAKTCGISDCHHNDLQLLEKVKIWLSSSCRQQPWLMIVDNADDIDVFQETEQDGSLRDRMAKFIPESPNGAILFTTRNIEVAADLAPGRHLIYVEEPSPEECVNLMKGRLPIGIYEDEDLGRLAEELGYLPLALVQATAYVKKKSLSVSQYLQSLSESGESALIRMLECEFREFGRDGGSDNRVPNAVARTWLVSFQAIERENKLAIELLNLAGCFDRQDIRRSFFVGYAENYKWYNQGLYQHLDYDIWYKHITLKLDEIERDHPNISRPVFRKPVEIGPQLHVGSTTLDDKVATSDPAMLDPQCLRVCKNDEKEREGEPRWSPTAEDVDDALALLMAYSFLTKGKEEMFTLHRLVHLVVQRQMKSKDCVAEIATKSMIIVSEEFPGSYGSECWDQIRPLMPHVNAVLNSGPKRMDCFWVAYLKAHFIHVVAGFLNITLPIDEPKKPAIIIPLMEEAVELFERTGDENFTVLAKTALAAFLVSVALPKAMEILEPLRLDASKKLGSRHGTTLYVTRKLAECYEDMGRLNDAGQLLDGAIDGFEGKANQAFWQLRDRTRVFRKQGRLEDAMVLARWLLCLAGHAVDMRNHTAAAHAVYCAASMGMNDEVLPLAHVAWYLVMTTLGERHPKALEWKEYIRLAEQCISRDILLKDIFPSVNTSVVAAEKWKNGLSQPPPSTSRIVNAILDDYKRGQDNLDGLAKDDWRRSWAWTNFQVFQDALRGYDGQYNKDGLREERIATKSILTA